MNSKTYDLKYDLPTQGYKPVEIPFALVRRSDQAEVEASSATIAAETDKLLTFAVRQEEKRRIATVGVAGEALARADFDQVIASPIKIQVTAKPPASPGKAAPKDIKGECLVQIAPIPAFVRLISPAPDQLPWQAKPENKMPVELQIFRGSETVPWANAVISLERKTPSDPACGMWAPESRAPRTTDAQGKVAFTFIPAELYYRPGGKYFEEFRVFTGERQKRREIGSFKLSLAPKLKFRIATEKTSTFGEGAEKKTFAIDFGEKPDPVELELGPALQVSALVVVPELPEDGQSSAARLPVAHAKLKTVFLDKDDNEIPLKGEPPITDAQGACSIPLPELAAAFPKPSPYPLKDHNQNPVGKLNPDAENSIAGYRKKVEQFAPKPLFADNLYQKLLDYRKTFCAQIAREKPERFATVESAAEILCAAATHTKLFNDMYNDQWGRLGDLFGNTLSDILSLVVTWTGVGEKCINDYAPGVARYFKGWIDDLAARPWVARVVGFLRTKLASGLAKIHGILTETLEWLGRNLPGTLKSITDRGSVLLRQLGEDFNRLANTVAPPNSGAAEAVSAIAEWFTNMFSLVFRAIGNVLKLLGEILVGLTTVVIQMLAALYAKARSAFDPVLENYLRPAAKATAEHIARALNRAFDVDLADHGYGTLFLAKMVEVFIAWLNEKIGASAWTGDKLGQIVNLLGITDLIDLMADLVVGCVHDNAEKLHVATPHTSRTIPFRDFCTAMREWKRDDEVNHAEIEEIFSHIENFIFCCELIIMLVVTLLSLGGAVVIGETFTLVEKVFGVFKLAILRLPQAIAIVVLGFLIAIQYTRGTLALTAV